MTISETDTNLDTVSCQAHQFAYMTIRDFLIGNKLLTADNSPMVVSDICISAEGKSITGFPTMTINF